MDDDGGGGEWNGGRCGDNVIRTGTERGVWGKERGGGYLWIMPHERASHASNPGLMTWGRPEKVPEGIGRGGGGGGLERRTRLFWEGWTLELDLVDGKREDHSGESVWRLWQ